jgi:hypothetical protein
VELIETIIRSILLKIKDIKDDEKARECALEIIEMFELRDDEKEEIFREVALRDGRIVRPGIVMSVDIPKERYNPSGSLFITKKLMTSVIKNGYKMRLVIIKE